MDISNEYAIGIDIGGTNTKYGLVNHRGEIIKKGDLKTDAYPTVELFVSALYETLQPVIKAQCKDGVLKGIGVGAPNGNYYNGTIEHAPNLNWKGIVPLAGYIADKFNQPCSLTNDANAAAVGEMSYGAARGMKNFIMITLGTGVGSGIVANGQVIYGEDGFAGELGHTVVRYGGRKHWSTQLNGTLEAFASATGIAYTAKEILDSSTRQSLLRSYKANEINSRIIYECASRGDEISREIFYFTGQVLGEALANFIMFSSPEAIILFGGVIKAGDLLLKPTKKYMEKNLLPVFRSKVKLIFSELQEADAAILGASALVWEMRPESPKVNQP